MPELYALGGDTGMEGILLLLVLFGLLGLYELSSPLRCGGVYTISVGCACGKVAVPHCPQNASSWPISFPHFGHLITLILFLVACLVATTLAASIIAHLLSNDYPLTQLSHVYPNSIAISCNSNSS
jgi:hypothetical protein